MQDEQAGRARLHGGDGASAREPLFLVRPDELTGTGFKIGPSMNKSRASPQNGEVVYQQRDTEPHPRNGVPRRGCTLEIGG